MGRPLVIFLQGASWETRNLAVSLALTAAALGEEVSLALSGEPLRLFVTGRFDEGGASAEQQGQPAAAVSLDAALGEARRGLGLRVVACPTLASQAGLDPARLVPPLDGLASLPALWRLAQAGRVLAL